MAGEGQDPSQFMKNSYKYKDAQGPNSMGDRSNSGYRMPQRNTF